MWRETDKCGITEFLLNICHFRISFVGEIGYELHVASNDAVRIYDVIMEEAEKFGACDAGYRSLACLSTEIGKKSFARFQKRA